MLHVVEIRFADERFQDVVLRVREWLNGKNVQPTAFRYLLDQPESMIWIDFAKERHAKAFAKAFGGVVLPERAGLAPLNAVSPRQN